MAARSMYRASASAASNSNSRSRASLTGSHFFRRSSFAEGDAPRIASRDVSAGFSCPTMALRLMVSPPPRVLLSKLSKVPLVPLPGLPGLPRPLPTEFGLPNGDACGSRPWMP